MTSPHSEIIGYTIGRLAQHDSVKRSQLIKIEYASMADGQVELIAVNSHTMRDMLTPPAFVSAEYFIGRPRSTRDAEAEWAMHLCGWELLV